MDKAGRTTVIPPSGSADVIAADDSADTETDTDPNEDGDTDEDSAEEPLTLTSLTAALQPLIDSIKNIETTMCGEMSRQTAMSKELSQTNEALNSVIEVVEVLASKPDGKAIEPKKNPFGKKEESVEMSRTFKIFHANNK